MNKLGSDVDEAQLTLPDEQAGFRRGRGTADIA